MLFKKTKRNIIDIPYDLRLELRKLQEEKNKYPKISYSLSMSSSEINNAKNSIKNSKIEPSFRETLFKYIDKTNLKDSDVYKKACVDRRIFSKIRNDEHYHPSKNIIICLALALNLEISDLEYLLNLANYSLPNNDYFNIAIKYCFKNKIFDIDQVNDILYACNLNLLTK